VLARRGGRTDKLKEQSSRRNSFVSARKILSSYTVMYCEYLSDYSVQETHYITYEKKGAFRILYADILNIHFVMYCINKSHNRQNNRFLVHLMTCYKWKINVGIRS
jgi:hypothetical protein